MTSICIYLAYVVVRPNRLWKGMLHKFLKQNNHVFPITLLFHSAQKFYIFADNNLRTEKQGLARLLFMHHQISVILRWFYSCYFTKIFHIQKGGVSSQLKNSTYFFLNQCSVYYLVSYMLHLWSTWTYNLFISCWGEVPVPPEKCLSVPVPPDMIAALLKMVQSLLIRPSF